MNKQFAITTQESPAAFETTNPSNNNSSDYIECNPYVNERNLLGFCAIFAFFVGGLITSAVIASKIIVIGPFILPASVFVWALTYPCSDIIAEVYGRRYANKLVIGGFIAYTLMMWIIYTAIKAIPAPFWDKQEEFESILGMGLRVMIAALISYVVTQLCDVYIFSYFRKKTSNRFLWLRNNGSTVISQTLANTIFLSIAFWGTMPVEKWTQLFANNLSARYLLLFLDTAVVYAVVYSLYRLYPELKPRK